MKVPQAPAHSIYLQRGEPWNDVWEKMKKLGWTSRKGDALETWYVVPGRSGEKKGNLLKDRDYFTGEGVNYYARSHYGWEDDMESVEDMKKRKEKKESILQKEITSVQKRKDAEALKKATKKAKKHMKECSQPKKSKGTTCAQRQKFGITISSLGDIERVERAVHVVDRMVHMYKDSKKENDVFLTNFLKDFMSNSIEHEK